MRYQDIVFVQSFDDDPELRRHVDAWDWQAAIDYLLQWDDPRNNPEVYADEPPHGSRDYTYRSGDLMLSANPRMGYAGLVRILPEQYDHSPDCD